ncbi:MAG: SUMF1/EgtB/PvdO family nonheme iron enzyme, partial [Sandaracinaceae bacterium]
VGTPCSAGGVSGSCQYTSECTGTSTPGLCPGPAEVQCCTARTDAGAGTCDPSDMPTPNAGLTEEAGDTGCPVGMVNLGAFCIDRFEASLVLVDGAGTPIGSWSPFHNPGTNRVAAVSLRNAVPQGYINGRQAADACETAGKRLCSNNEWLSACQGAAGRTYPYGNTRRPGVCNDARATHPAVERFGTSADWIWSELDDACINQIPDSVALTGAHPECTTPEGVLDLMGNLHEWTSDTSGTFRGGFYADTRINGEGCLYRTTAHSTGHHDYSTGFRCCAATE